MILSNNKKSNSGKAKNNYLYRSAKLLIAGAIFSGLAACSHPRPVNYSYIKADSNVNQENDPQVQSQLVEAAASVSQSLQQLSAIKEAKNPDVKLPTYKQYDEIGANHTASLKWNGPVVPALKTIAKTINYKLVVLGKEPASPALVVLAEENQPIPTILRNINYQLTINNTASIRVYASKKILELRYNK
jgi:hypothetical protein